MQAFSSNLDVAYAHVKTKRPIIEPNWGFQRALLLLNKRLNPKYDDIKFHAAFFRDWVNVPKTVSDDIITKALRASKNNYLIAYSELKDTNFYSKKRHDVHDPMEICILT
jgi:hypothetical protein